MDTFEKLSVLEKGMMQSLNKNAKAEVAAPAAASVAAPAVLPTEASTVHLEPIAIIGMAGNFPACMTLQEFWAALDLDTSLIQETPDSRAAMSAPGTTVSKHWGGFIPDIAGFDADFFGISALDANVMDPRQRLLLMSVYHCLEDACCIPGSLAGSDTGVYVAAEEDQYAQTMLLLGIDTRDGIGQSASMLANRISYHFDLRGPSESINAMCSGAAVALHRAVSALRTGEISQAIVGAANLLLRPEPYDALERANLLNRTSTVASFGRQANGHLRSEGVISLLLKPLKQAEKDGDAIYAVIKNTAVNFNGRGGLSIGAPNPSAHADLVERCYDEAGIDPRDLGYIEAQGMGNPLSDSAEWRAFNRALENVAKKKNVTLPEQYCRVSSLKPMIGHMEAASALGAVAKIIRSFQNGKIHKIRGLNEINEDLEIAGQACRLATSTETWARTKQARLAALHSFGTGGNNAHILLEEYQAALPPPGSRGHFPCLIPLSAKNPGQLSALVKNLKKHIDENADLVLEDVAFSLQTGREMMNVRLGLLVHSLAELSEVLGKLARQDLSKPSSTIALNDVYFGCKDETELTLSLLANDEDMEKTIEAWMDKGKFGKLLSIWSKGLAINWKTLYGKGDAYLPRQKIRLPAYPFERRYHWFDADREPNAIQRVPSRHAKNETQILSTGDEPAQYLVRFLSLRLRASAEIDLDIPMNRLGINSLVLLELKRELASEFGYASSILHLMSDTTSIRRLAEEIKLNKPHAEQETPTVPTIKDQASRYALSRNQRALWFIQQLSPTSSAYNISYAIHLNHAIHLPTLASALSRVMARHSILRARFHADVLLEPYFILEASHDLPLKHIDATTWTEQEIENCLAQEADAPFDLGHDGVCRMALIETDATKENLFVFSVHHIAWDYLSFDILMKELGHFYAPASSTFPEELPWQYADYINWEKQFLLGEKHALSKQYWCDKLKGDLPTLNLPTDYPRPVIQTYRGETYCHAIDKPTCDRVHELSKSRGITPYMILLSSFQVLLNRYTAQDDILIGLPAAGRDASETRNLIGYFVNPVVLRIPFKSSISFDDLLLACRTEVLETLEHQQYSLEQLVNDLAIERDPGRPLLFQVLVNWQSLRSTDISDNPSQMWFSQVTGTQRGAAFDITLNLLEHDSHLECQWVYNTSLFCQETIARMAHHFSSLLNSALRNPESALADLEMPDETGHQFLTRRDFVATRPSEIAFKTHAGNVEDGLPSSAEPRALSPVEEKLRSIWSEILACRQIGVTDSFFRLGGHSLLAMLVMSRVREQFDLELTLDSLFQFPTIASFAKLIERELQIQKQDKSAEIVHSEHPITLMSYAQNRIWFLDQLVPDNLTYSVPLNLEIEGEIDAGILETCFKMICQRHRILNSYYPIKEQQAYTAYREAEFKLAVFEAEQEAAALSYVQKPFNLLRGPLFRAALVRYSTEKNALYLCMHHIISDGWSLGILMDEIAEIYDALLGRREIRLPALPIQYADYVEWQRDQFTRPSSQHQLAYWKQQLEGAPPLFHPPLDYPRPPVPAFKGASVKFDIDKTLTDKLNALAQAQDATLFMVLLAAFGIQLARYTGGTDVVIGSPIAGRQNSQVESLIGLFLNTIVLRLDYSGAPGFTGFLGRVRKTCLDAYTHQDVPFDRLVEELQPDRNLAHSPLFQVMFVLQNQKMNPPGFGQSKSRFQRLENPTAKFDLTLSLDESEDGLHTSFEYNVDLFSAASVERFALHFKELLHTLMENPEADHFDYCALSEQDAAQLRAWNDTAIDYPKEQQLLPELFLSQVRRTPDRIALTFEGEQLSYKLLNQRANRLAACLRRHGVTPNVVVGICMQRSIELVVGLLAIQKAGGAYLPLDPSYPDARLRYMMDDARITLLLTHPAVAQSVSSFSGTVVSLDGDAIDDGQHADDAWSEDDCPNPASPEHLAYVIYTSGSTGNPKGVGNSHEGIFNRLYWMQQTFPVLEGDAVLQKTPFGFDVSVWEFFLPLLFGGRLVIAKPNGHQDPAYLVRLIREQNVTHLHFVPSMLEIFSREKNIETLDSIKYLFCSGEALSFDLRTRFLKRLPIALHNLYGPTEAAVDVSHCPCGPDEDLDLIPIGKPIANIQLHIVDPHCNPVPIGVVGELLIGGIGLARGYVNRPALTAEKFIPDPFSAEPGARLYKTGDLARYLSDGNIQYLGRIDNQVKIRGFRIELGEIENVILEHPNVVECTVIVQTNSELDKRLIAFIVTGGKSLDANTLHIWGAERLQSYMVPSAFIDIEQMPLNANGKVDRSRLVQRARDLRDTGNVEHAAPKSDQEALLSEIWCDILKLDSVSVRSDFFALGGHSLLAMQVVSRIRDVFFVELPLHVLFQNPTIEYMAAQIDTQRFAQALPAITPVADEEVPLSYAQTRFWFLDQLEGQSSNYNMAIAIRFDGPLHQPALLNALRSLVERHKALRSYFISKDGMPYLGFTDSAFEIPTRQLDHLTPEARSARLDELIAEEAKTAFVLADGGLFRASLLQLGKESHVLMVTMHHIISDGWSIGILMNDLREYYAAYSEEKPILLPDLPIEYGDFSAWQRQYFDRDYLAQQINYWKNQLQSAPELLQLPTDFPRPPVQTTNGSEWRFTLDKSTKIRLEALSQQEGATLFMTLLSAFSLLLGRYSGAEDIVIGSLVAGRNLSQIETVVGVFVNTIALRIDLSDSPDFSALLKRVKEITLGAYSHQDVPFDRLVQELRPERNLSFSPLFQVMFVLQNAPMELLELPGLQATPLMQHNKTSKFDILFSMEENHKGMECILEYNSDLFKESTMQRFGEQFLLLVDAILDAPDAPVHSHAIQTLGEKELLATWRAALPSVPAHVQSLPAIFEHAVQKAPESIALVLEDEAITYDQLNRRANRLAHQLRAMGVGPDFLVGICLERSTDMIVAILAVLKAGGAYVPLDPAYPDSSLQFMVRDAALAIIVTTGPLTSKFGTGAETASLLLIDQDIQATNEQNPDWHIDPEHLAYVIYTSGSTGTPKGVLVTHANVSRLFSATRPWFEFNEHDVWTLFHSYAFDFSIWEIWGAFVHGARLVIVPYMTSRSPLDFYQLLIRQKVTVLSQTPSAFRQLMNADNELDQTGETALRYVIFGGEALDLEKLRPWLERHGDQEPQLVNMYGITETTVHVTCHPITLSDLEHPVSNIGVPIADLQVHILDQSLKPVPLGAVGEMHIAGAGLARGYLNRPELTAQRFIAYPDGLENREQNPRLYKSGDLGRFLPDGKIEYLGRIDNQVKIRGFRIELEEIEAVLLKAENVIESVVIVVGAASEEKQLLAFVCADTPELIDINAIRRFAGQRLPVHMVPQAYVVLDTIPLTRNGKVDRALLAKISKDKYQRVKEVEYVAPRDGLELRMCQVWEDLLQVKPIGMTDNFFDLGGHSLVAVTLMSRIAQKFNQKLPLASLFQNATVEKLSNLLKGQNGDRYFTSLVSVNANGSKLPFFCFPGAGGSVVYLYELARQLGDDQPFYGLQAVGLDGETDPLEDVKDMAAYWLEEVLKIHPEGPFLLGGHSFGGKIAFELAQQLIRRGREVALVVVLGTTAPHPDMVPIAQDWEGTRFLPELGKVMEEYLERPLGITEELLSTMSEPEQLEYVKNILIAANWLPPEIETKQFLGIVNVYRTNVSADYQPQNAVELDQLVLVKGDTEKQYWPIQNEPEWGWDRFAKQVTIHITPGSHTSMLANPNVQSLAHYLRDCFTQASTVAEPL
ncbi:amino acid adenylation enzyme/thioester reductase family protein [Herbaspirillum sp. CF444]|uniref:non-ribosomal peptide synthetase n=1 Tax=Herbaspirillum sp. CF444 TaxID=1144319 RepID=UPI0002726862|nr:non-ribosomal peptide synthetase [Herbaspirillum sp. CF444]EJL94065.1 amino acid adenylation enzyme/thioester reductase family protein [Herbaspirillum sp. CF444]